MPLLRRSPRMIIRNNGSGAKPAALRCVGGLAHHPIKTPKVIGLRCFFFNRSGMGKGRLKILNDTRSYRLNIFFNQQFGQFLQRHAFGSGIIVVTKTSCNTIIMAKQTNTQPAPMREQERNGGGNGGGESTQWVDCRLTLCTQVWGKISE